MLRYASVVKDALNNAVKPVLVDFIVKCFGKNWYNDIGREILEDFSDFEKNENRIRQGFPAEEVLDTTALLYIMFPYNDGNDSDSPGGLMSYAAVTMTLEPWQIRKLKHIRFIRNQSSHDMPEPNRTVTPTDLANGVQERAWLKELEEIVGILRPGFSLAKYYSELDRKIAESNTDTHTQESVFQRVTFSTRPEFSKLTHEDFANAPIQQPIVGAAPWVRYPVDLDKLPWPSEEKTAKQAAAEAAAKAVKAPRNNYGKSLFGLFEKMK